MGQKKVSNDEQTSIKQYLAQLKSKDSKVRMAAIVMLSIEGRNYKKKVIPAITKCLEDETLEVRRWAALILADFGENPKNTISILIEILKEEKNDDMRSLAATTLGEIRNRTIETIPVLKQALTDDNWRVREQAAFSLEKLEGKQTKELK
ncbi:MAG: HEAT repeat domain-containing protein [Candidatus Heimdallarchaeota archaeon]